MAHEQRPRYHLSPAVLTLVRPVLRKSPTRDAYVLRMVGNHFGPVLRYDRRRSREPYVGIERRAR